MKLIKVNSRAEEKKFLAFRKKIYKEAAKYVDNNTYMIKQVFAGKMVVLKNLLFKAYYVEDDNGAILCETMFVYADKLPDTYQICFFEALEGAYEAVRMLIDKAEQLAGKLGCTKLVVGLCGHLNYGLGLLASHFDEVNSFSAPGNPAYYLDYFDKDFEKVDFESFYIDNPDERLDSYSNVYERILKEYEVRLFDKRDFDYWSEKFTDLNNDCFADHKYYYHRDYEEDKEMLKELFMFMDEDSLIFLCKDGEPVAFILWYPDYNELAAKGTAFGVKHFIKNLIGMKVKTVKVMEFGVLPKYRAAGLPFELIHQAAIRMKKYGCQKVETSWVMCGNRNSEAFCEKICDRKYKEYVVYEKDL